MIATTRMTEPGEQRTLRDVWERLKDERLDVTDRYISLLEYGIKKFEAANGIVTIDQLQASHVRAMMRALLGNGRSAITCNNYRRVILTLWTAALDYGWPAAPFPRRSECRRLREPDKVPTAWRPHQMDAIAMACRQAPTRRGWGPPHWEALVLVCLQTSLRLGCLLKSNVSQVDADAGTLEIPGEFQKSKRGTRHTISDETVQMLLSLPRPEGDERLFPWPFARDELHRRYKTDVLIPASLPHSRRDLFHKFRRTSYTLIAKRFGVSAASEHASHRQDMSDRYLDKTMLDRPNPLAAIPLPLRPAPELPPAQPPRLRLSVVALSQDGWEIRADGHVRFREGPWHRLDSSLKIELLRTLIERGPGRSLESAEVAQIIERIRGADAARTPRQVKAAMGNLRGSLRIILQCPPYHDPLQNPSTGAGHVGAWSLRIPALSKGGEA